MVLLQTNVQVMKEIMTQITTYTRSAIIINVSNPMDILTYIAQKEFNYPRNLLIGTGIFWTPPASIKCLPTCAA